MPKADAMTDLEIFINAPDDLKDAERDAYFDEACGDDEKLRAGVEALVAAHRKSPHVHGINSGSLLQRS